MEKPLFELPVIRTRGMDLSKRWYIEAKFLNPKTGKNERFRRFCSRRTIADQQTRLEELIRIKKEWTAEILSGRFNPFGMNLAGLNPGQYYSISDAIGHILTEGESWMRPTAFANIKSRFGQFEVYLARFGLVNLSPDHIRKETIAHFLTSITRERGLAPRTRNNFLTDLKSGFQRMKENGFIAENPCEGISKLPCRSDQHRSYKKHELERLSKYLAEKDPYLHLFCKFILMGFRPIEIVRLQIGNIDLEDFKIVLPASKGKTDRRIVRRIFDRFRPEVEALHLEDYPQHYYLFSSSGMPSAKAANRDYFSAKFQRVKKALNFGQGYTMYGLRHTAIIEMHKAGAHIREIMSLTGHKTLSATQAYLQQYLDEPLEDVSKYMKFDF